MLFGYQISDGRLIASSERRDVPNRDSLNLLSVNNVAQTFQLTIVLTVALGQFSSDAQYLSSLAPDVNMSYL
jgi:hypothetical protein